jgi:hypothetical protein
VSQTVRDLAAGSGIHFAARGKHKLRGVEDEPTTWAARLSYTLDQPIGVRPIGPAGRPTKTNTFMKSGNASGVCGAASIATYLHSI